MAIDQDYIDQYRDLLIKQYWDKSKARSTVDAVSSEFSMVFDFYQKFYDEFDLDIADGDRLDIIGAIVGRSRIVPFSKAKLYFGFDDNPNSGPFGDKFDDTIIAYPFKDKFEPAYTDTQLNDNDYKFFIKAKISKNVVSAYMTSDDRISIQDVINQLFSGNAYVTDDYDMTLTLYIDYSVDTDLITLIKSADLLPKPQGVRYEFIVQYDSEGTFGFSNNPNSLGFGDKFDSAANGGRFASKLI